MTSLSAARVQYRLIELMDCLTVVDDLINCHVANFFTSNLWHKVLPKQITVELENMNYSDFIADYLRFLNDSKTPWADTCPHLNDFLVKSNKLSIYKDSSCLTSLQSLTSMMKCEQSSMLRLKDFMSEKKKHEVEKTGLLAEALSKLTKTTRAVDIGGGKGYLSSVLSQDCGLEILSLDSSAMTTCSAEKLEKKMKKINKRKIDSSNNCQRETAFVSSHTNLNDLLDKHFGSSPAGLMGLHTCGNLATTCVKLFVSQKTPWLINVGCCYHLIAEQFDQHAFWSDFQLSTENGFPVSQFMTNRKAKLGRNARMLAAHSLERLARDGFNEKSTQSLFYRALLQIIVEQVRGHSHMEGQIGRLFKKCENFQQYVRRAVQKLQLGVEISEEEIESLMTRYQDQEIKLQVFTILRTHFAPLIESVILLDRLLFLYEQGVAEAHLVPLFDPALSPRSHAIVAWK